ncbi:MAG TPA: hypothetical protein VFX12_01355 [Vicinamibacterales bacterium]|nr:hypothetical protein [Vicinamibacterales bacterium]
MADVHEIEALKASMRGARATAAALQAVGERVDAFDPHGEAGEDLLEDLRRVTAAHAVAAQALRGFVDRMLRRRGLVSDETVTKGGSEDE